MQNARRLLQAAAGIDPDPSSWILELNYPSLAPSPELLRPTYAYDVQVDADGNCYWLFRDHYGGSSGYSPAVLKTDVLGTELWQESLRTNFNSLFPGPTHFIDPDRFLFGMIESTNDEASMLEMDADGDKVYNRRQRTDTTNNTALKQGRWCNVGSDIYMAWQGSVLAESPEVEYKCRMLSKYSAGVHQWTRAIIPENVDANMETLLPDFVAYDGTDLVVQISVDDSNYESWLVRIDTDGDYVSAYATYRTSYNQSPAGVVCDGDGNTYELIRGTIPGNSKYKYLQKRNSSGTVQWRKLISSSDSQGSFVNAAFLYR